MIHLIGTKPMKNLMHTLYLYMQLDEKLQEITILELIRKVVYSI